MLQVFKKDESMRLIEFFFTVTLKVIACKAENKRFDLEGILFQRIGIIIPSLPDGIGVASVNLIIETSRTNLLCI